MIVVDDGSPMRLVEQPEIVEAVNDERVTFLRKPNGGPASARNYGLDKADDGYVFMLDSDDVLERTAIERLLNALLQAGAEFAAGGWANFSVAPEDREVLVPKIRYQDPYANCVDQGWVPGSVMINNKYKTRYNETRMPWEALEFFLDYLAIGRSAVYVEDVIVNMRQHRNPERLTIKYNHFELFNTGSFFAQKKQQLSEKHLINVERAAALDARILGCVHALLRDSTRAVWDCQLGINGSICVVGTRLLRLVLAALRISRREVVHCLEPPYRPGIGGIPPGSSRSQGLILGAAARMVAPISLSLMMSLSTVRQISDRFQRSEPRHFGGAPCRVSQRSDVKLEAALFEALSMSVRDHGRERLGS